MSRWPRGTPQERFWRYVNKNGAVPESCPDLGACWNWTAYLNKNGYGVLGRSGTLKRTMLAHIFSYEMLVGKIPVGLELDHLCRIPKCVNPSHLEPVTHKVNMLRGDGPTANNAKKTHCPKGHPLSGNNLLAKHSGRKCLICHLDYQRKYKEMNKLKLAEYMKQYKNKLREQKCSLR